MKQWVAALICNNFLLIRRVPSKISFQMKKKGRALEQPGSCMPSTRAARANCQNRDRLSCCHRFFRGFLMLSVTIIIIFVSALVKSKYLSLAGQASLVQWPERIPQWHAIGRVHSHWIAIMIVISIIASRLLSSCWSWQHTVNLTRNECHEII